MPLKSDISFENLEVAFASKSNAELRKMYFIFWIMSKTSLVNFFLKITEWGFKYRLPLFKVIIRKTVFDHFCGGESIGQCQRTIDKLATFNIGSILDFSVEGMKYEESYDLTKNEIIKTIDRSATEKNIPFAVFKVSGLGNTELMTLIQSGSSISNNEEKSFQFLESRVDEICKRAYEVDTKVLIDAEESWFQELIDTMVYKAMSKYNREKCIVFNTYQMYQRNMLRDLKVAHQVAASKGFILGAKLVRGAYMEKERVRSLEYGYPDPIHSSKTATDEDYNNSLRYCLAHHSEIHIVNGSHNEKSNSILIDLMTKQELAPHDEKVYYAQLYGMSDNLSYNLAKAGYNVVKYIPYGPIEKVMPYLGRRIRENTSVTGQSNRELEMIMNEIKRRKTIKTNKPN